MLRAAPGSAKARIEAAHSAFHMNYPRQEIALLAPLDPQRGVMKGRSVYWSRMNDAYHLLGAHRKELQVARQGRRQLPENSSLRFLEVRALSALGRAEDAHRLLNEEEEGESMLQSGAELRAHGFPEAAAEMLERAIAWYERQPEGVQKTYGLARAFYLSARWEEARVHFERLEGASGTPYYGTALQIRSSYALAALAALALGLVVHVSPRQPRGAPRRPRGGPRAAPGGFHPRKQREPLPRVATP